MFPAARLAFILLCSLPLAATDEWYAYGHDGAGTKHSPLKQINTGNVTRLRIAWTYRTGDLYQKPKRGRQSSQQTTPIYVSAPRKAPGMEVPTLRCDRSRAASRRALATALVVVY